jgi:ribosomal protein S17
VAETPAAGGWTGTVVETTNASIYTYVLVDTGKEKIWAAAPQFAVKVGDKVNVPAGMPMENFQSKALNRTFDKVYFATKIAVNGADQSAQAAVQQAHAAIDAKTGPSPATAIDFSGLKKAEGGVTVAEILAGKTALQGKTVRVRAKVVKYNAEIMNKNWLHLQDGTGAPGANDLTVTTADTAKVGDTVLVNGTLALDKDFGYGYKYAVLVENATLSVEKEAKP